MTISQILKANEILCIVPDARKALAVKNCFEGQVSPMAPASALQKHRDTTVYLRRRVQLDAWFPDSIELIQILSQSHPFAVDKILFEERRFRR